MRDSAVSNNIGQAYCENDQERIADFNISPEIWAASLVSCKGDCYRYDEENSKASPPSNVVGSECNQLSVIFVHLTIDDPHGEKEDLSCMESVHFLEKL